MVRVKRREFTGDVCEQIVYNVADGEGSLWRVEPRPRFENQEERDKFNAAVSLRRFTKIMNCFPPTSLYSTLTLGPEDECHDFDEARQIINAYIRVLKYHHPEVKLVVVMGRGRHTHRIHYHMVSDGVSAEELQKYWKYGKVERAEPLRAHNYYNGVDRGRDYASLAKYLHDHWTPEQGGRRRWKQTNNLNRPETEKPKTVKRKYTVEKPPRPPKGYKLVEARAGKYGFIYYRYVRIPPRDEKRRR